MTTTLLAATIDSGTFIAILLGVTGAIALIALAIFLFKLLSTLKRVDKMIVDITPAVEETAEKLPTIVDNVEIISGNLIDITDSVAETLPEVLDDVDSVTGAISDITDSTSNLVVNITDTFNGIVGARRARAEKGGSNLQYLLPIISSVLGIVNKKKRKK
ncbi:MAG: hypothetical protein ACOYH4_02095 [Saccharofermentanales bacterium]|jgi:uncharacterized protein YoxC